MTETKTLTTHVQGKIIQLDYDFITSLNGKCSYCLTDAQVQMILSITDYYGWSTRWYSADGLIDQSVITDLQGGLIEALMCGCCNDNSVLSRYTADGHYQQSHDGGATWTDTPSADGRNQQPFAPEYLPDGTIDDSCTYADSIVQLIHTQMVDNMASDATKANIINTIISVFAGVAGALSETFIGSIVALLFGAVAILIVLATVPVWQAAMTDDVFDRLRCNIKNHIETDGSFTQADLDAIYAQIGTDETGIAALFLRAVVASFGVVGMTNSARAGYGAPDAECCSTACNTSSWTIYSGYGTINTGTRTANFTEIAATFDGSLYNVVFVSPDADECCDIGAQADNSGQIYYVSGSATSSGYSPCGNDPSNSFVGWLSLAFGSRPLNGIAYASNVPFTLAIDTTRT